MNPLNYATLPACQKLAEKGIVLETERFWYLSPFDKWELSHDYDGLKDIEHIPAPSMAEVWRELPEFAHCGAPWNAMRQEKNINPTDALIDLLIWVAEFPKEAK
ncbi:MAG: hypothetical protein IMZ61_14440 [Planctomycetes bacterium]|nr:hypothetical protein [Planctomycetota bacterium]